MISTVIAFDDIDADFGQYFTSSHADILAAFQANAMIANTSICGADCSEINVNSTVDSFDGQPFIFVAISHGNEDEFHSQEVYLSKRNASKFKNSFVYSTACLTGKNIGRVLIENGSHAFIGYNETILVAFDYAHIFYACENYGIKSFLNSEETIEICYNKIVAKYTDEIDKLYNGSMDDLIIAATLVDNRDKLILLGDFTLTREHFVSRKSQKVNPLNRLV